MDEVLDRSIADQAAMLRAGEIGCVELMQATLARIAKRDPDLDAFVHLDTQAALSAAGCAQRTLHADEPTPPLTGIPFAVKDLFDVAGQPGFCGSHAIDPAIAKADAETIGRLRAAGAIPIGKVATYEFALTGPAFDQPYPPARNPWNTSHITGGSSSGSAAAVAGGLVRFAIGTDTGGSVRSPASYCGVVGLKPSRGRISSRGVFPLAGSLDTPGPIAASVAEAAMILDAMGEPGRTDGASSLLGTSIGGLRVAFAREWVESDPATDGALLPALDDAAGTLSRLGTAIDLVSMPDYDLFEAAGSVILQHEAFASHRERLKTRFADYGRAARGNLLTGAILGEDDLEAAREASAGLAARVDALFAKADVLITATTLGPAPCFSDFKDGAAWTPMRTFPFSLTGHPAISLPCGFSRGMPLGLQIVAPHGAEARLCQVAHAFERASDHALVGPYESGLLA
ncbi:amidase [Pararhizobium mangrovi]|uniref:Indoleacetamide hydrolase n=1 Tax=Pararhizobium mangrovi TaxID=2590452 RepID=A0A506U7Q2_9HYPH|nr:amidase [Pararhizobium mangrovi]TPW28985.1 amidase [Pararhizobium mangrovi]